MKPDMKVQLAGLELLNPIVAASGTFGYGIEFEEIVSLERIGGFVTKGISQEPMAGHQPPRILQTAAGMLNAIGLQNIGVEEFVAHKLPPLARYPKCQCIVNVFGFTVGEYIAVINRLNQAEGIAAYELNVSCPNVHMGGMSFGADAGSLEYLVKLAKAVAKRPLIVKLSPNVTSIALMSKVAAEAGADALSLVNTFLAMSIDVETRKPRLSNVTGGLSGPAIKPIALRMVYEASRAVRDSGHWHGRHCDSGRCGGVSAGGGDCGAGGHGELCRPARRGADCERPGVMVPQPPRGKCDEPDRRTRGSGGTCEGRGCDSGAIGL